MKAEYLKEKQLLFIDSFDPDRIEQTTRLLAEFSRDFPKSTIKSLPINEYVYGRFPIDEIKTFCYWMEKMLQSSGKIAGSPCSQYGIWYGTHRKDKAVRYRHTKRYGSSVDGAFERVKQEIVELLAAGGRKDYEAIANSMIAEKFRGKILATYFPDDYLSIYAGVYLDDILKYFNLDDEGSPQLHAILKQLRLIQFKQNDPIMKRWSLMKFAMFLNDELYMYYYKETAHKDEEDRVPGFPNLADIDPEFIEQTIDVQRDATARTTRGSRIGKTDHVRKTIRNKAIGDRGEQIVEFLERRELITAGRADLAAKVDWIAKREDGHGYDIISRELNGDKKYIEVKSTVKHSGNANFFLSVSELDKCRDLKNYYVYYVYDVESKKPLIWKIPNPFHPEQAGIRMDPALYYVTIFRK
ncbi:MAG: protein NO VEIN domain-containing protein [Daejeonella sp.]